MFRSHIPLLPSKMLKLSLVFLQCLRGVSGGGAAAKMAFRPRRSSRGRPLSPRTLAAASSDARSQQLDRLPSTPLAATSLVRGLAAHHWQSSCAPQQSSEPHLAEAARSFEAVQLADGEMDSPHKRKLSDWRRRQLEAFESRELPSALVAAATCACLAAAFSSI